MQNWLKCVVKSLGHVVLQVLVLVYKSPTALLGPGTPSGTSPHVPGKLRRSQQRRDWRHMQARMRT
jgi:hypothetical protein